MSIPRKHHFLPAFYLTRWANAEGMITQYSRPHGDLVKPLRRHPNAVGWIDRLYAMQGLPDEIANRFESEFLAPVDSLASDALRRMEAQTHDWFWTEGERSAWSRFLMSLLMRMPADIHALRRMVQREWANAPRDLENKYQLERGPDDPKSLKDFVLERSTFDIGHMLMNHDRLKTLIELMHWSIVDIRGFDEGLLTSDWPVLMTSSLTEPDAFLVLPIGPAKLFVAGDTDLTVRRIVDKPPTQIGRLVNKSTVEHARSYVYGSSDRQLRFVQNHMGKVLYTSLMEKIERFRLGATGFDT